MFCHVIWKVSAEESFDDMRYCHHCVKQRHLCYYCRVNDACTVNYLTNTTEDLWLNIKRINCVDRTQDFCQKIAKTLPKHCQKIAKVEKHHLNPWTIIQCHHWINSRSKLSKFELNAEAEELWRWAEMTTDKGVKADTAGHGRVIWWHTLLPPDAFAAATGQTKPVPWITRFKAWHQKN